MRDSRHHGLSPSGAYQAWRRTGLVHHQPRRVGVEFKPIHASSIGLEKRRPDLGGKRLFRLPAVAGAANDHNLAHGDDHVPDQSLEDVLFGGWWRLTASCGEQGRDREREAFTDHRPRASTVRLSTRSAICAGE